MPHIALLAPVSIEHLNDALSVCATVGRVAFGSRAWEVFRELDESRNGLPVQAYIYASDEPGSAYPEVTWIGRYVRHVEAKNGSHPEGMKYRPPSTAKYPTDNKGHWAVFWELDQIRRLKSEDKIPMSAFAGYKTGKPYKKHFIPEGPLVVSSEA